MRPHVLFALATHLLVLPCNSAMGQSVTPGLSPEQSVASMTTPVGMEVSVVAAEPLVRQPVAIEFDDRGRLWVIQYLQYPNPNGLTRVSVDPFSRTKYDRVPEPPPYGPRGSDRSLAPSNQTLMQLCIALRQSEPISAAVREAFDPKSEIARRVELLGTLSQIGDPSLIAPSLAMLSSNEAESVRAAALQVLARFDEPRITESLMGYHQSSLSESLNSQIRDVLLGRLSSAQEWLSAIDRGEIAATSTSMEQVRRVMLLGNAQLDAIVSKHWGKLHSKTREEKLAEVRRLNNDLRAAEGNNHSGHELFKKHCAACHQLFGEGTKVGPDLTSANRQDKDFLLLSLVDPSNVIRKEYVCVVIRTTSGRILTGLAIDRNEASITLVDSKGEKFVVTHS